ncbi:hypothetical protein NMG60_11037536 [Bertholletia excelsa]
MASISHYLSDSILCNQLCEYPTFGGDLTGVGVAAMGLQQGLPFFDGGALELVPTDPRDLASSYPPYPFTERFPTSDMAVPALSEYNIGPRDIVRSQSFESGGYYHDVREMGDECNGSVSDFHKAYPSSGDNWGFQVTQVAAAMEEQGAKVGKYSVEERKDRILRYLKKRKQRNFNKTIKYACRKTLADKRVRVRGRFARNNELCQGEAMTMRNNNTHQDAEFYFDENIKIKQDEEDWLQEAVASLLYLPYISG